MQCAHEPCTCVVMEHGAFCSVFCQEPTTPDTCSCGHPECEAANPLGSDLDVDVNTFEPHTLGESVKAPNVKPLAR